MSEKIYDDKVAPLLKEAANICKKNNMSIVCIVEFSPNCTGETISITGKQGIETTMAYLAVKSNGNADKMLFNLVHYAKEKGHNSIMLKKLGA